MLIFRLPRPMVFLRRKLPLSFWVNQLPPPKCEASRPTRQWPDIDPRPVQTEDHSWLVVEIVDFPMKHGGSFMIFPWLC